MKKSTWKSFRLDALALSVAFHLVLFLLIGGIVLFEAPIMRQNMQIDNLVSVSQDMPQEDELILEELEEPAIESMDEPMLEDSSAMAAVTPIEIPDVIVSSAISTDSSFSVPVGSYVSAGSITGLTGGGSGTGTGVGKGVMGKFKMSNFFGSDQVAEGTLVGTFYDLKQSRGKKLFTHEVKAKEENTPKATNAAGSIYINKIQEFIESSWNPSVFKDYYKSPIKLSTPVIFVPTMPADGAPKAFKVQKEVSPSRWAIHYKGNIIAPKTGKFRFVGIADDILVLRLKKRNILNASLLNYFNPNWNKLVPNQTKMGKFHNWPFLASEWQQFEKGQSYPIEILIGEVPGQNFCAFLMIQEEGVKYQKGTFGLPALPLFRTMDANLPRSRGEGPKVSRGGPIFGLQ